MRCVLFFCLVTHIDGFQHNWDTAGAYPVELVSKSFSRSQKVDQMG